MSRALDRPEDALRFGLGRSTLRLPLVVREQPLWRETRAQAYDDRDRALSLRDPRQLGVICAGRDIGTMIDRSERVIRAGERLLLPLSDSISRNCARHGCGCDGQQCKDREQCVPRPCSDTAKSAW